MIINGFIPVQDVFSTAIETEKNIKESNKTSFSDVLSKGLNQINDLQIQSESATKNFVAGGDIEIHEVMLKAEEAKVALQFAVQTRNKLVEAFNEINRMQL